MRRYRDNMLGTAARHRSFSVMSGVQGFQAVEAVGVRRYLGKTDTDRCTNVGGGSPRRDTPLIGQPQKASLKPRNVPAQLRIHFRSCERFT